VPKSDPGDWIEHALVQQGPACYWALDAAGRFRFASGNTSPLFGKPAAELSGRLLADLMPEDEAHKWMGRIHHTIAGESVLRR